MTRGDTSAKPSVHVLLASTLALCAVPLAAVETHLFERFSESHGVTHVSVSAVGVEPVSLGEPVLVDAAFLLDAPATLVVPDASGGFVVLERRHFALRDGVATWAGAIQGQALETALFTSDGEQVVGSFQLDGEQVELRAPLRGPGWLYRTPGGETDDWCETPDPELRPSHSLPLRAASRVRAAGGSTNAAHQVDVVFGVSSGAVDRLDELSSVALEVAHIVNYANQAIRNTTTTQLIEFRSVGIAEGFFDHLNVDSATTNPYRLSIEHENTIQALRNKYGADLAHLIVRNKLFDARNICGVAPILLKGDTAELMSFYAYGITDLGCGKDDPSRARRTFAHEVGHNLGLNHNVGVLSGAVSNTFGSQTGFGWLANPGSTDVDPLTPTPTPALPGAYTIMAYEPPDGVWHDVPLYSSPYVVLGGGDHGLPSVGGVNWFMGEDVHGDSARVLAESGGLIASLSDHQYDLTMPATDFRVTEIDKTDDELTVRFAWADNSNPWTWVKVEAALWTYYRRFGQITPLNQVASMPFEYAGFSTAKAAELVYDARYYAAYPLDDHLLRFRLWTHAAGGPTMSNWATVDQYLTTGPEAPPTKPVLLEPRFGSAGRWCLPIRFNHADTESARVHVSWYNEDLWESGHGWYNHPVNRASLCVTGHVGDEIDAYAEAKNTVGTTRSDTKSFKVPRVAPRAPTTPVIGDIQYELPTGYSRERNSGEWCTVITVNTSDTASLWVGVSTFGESGDWKQIADDALDTGAPAFCYDSDVGDRIRMTVNAWSTENYRHPEARRSQAVKTFVVVK